MCIQTTGKFLVHTLSSSKIQPNLFLYQNRLSHKSMFFHCVLWDSLDGIEDRYILEGQLGKGSFGEVCLCREIATGDMYAAKIIDLKQVHYRVGWSCK